MYCSEVKGRGDGVLTIAGGGGRSGGDLWLRGGISSVMIKWDTGSGK